MIAEEIRGLSMKQPYASLMLYGKEETRTWHTNYRGLVLICVSKAPYTIDSILNIAGKNQFARIMDIVQKEQLSGRYNNTLGKAIAVGRLVDCRIWAIENPERTKESEDKCFVKYQFGLYRHIYENVRAIEPFDIKGKLNYFPLTE